MLEPLLKIDPDERVDVMALESIGLKMFEELESLNNKLNSLPSSDSTNFVTRKEMFMNLGYSFQSREQIQKDSQLCWAFTTVHTFLNALIKFFGTVPGQSDGNEVKDLFWDVLQIFIACVQPRSNEGIRTVGVLTDVLESFDQRAYLCKALNRMAYPTFFAGAGWKLLPPVVNRLKLRVNPNDVDVEVKYVSFQEAKQTTSSLAVVICKGSSIGKPSTACILGRLLDSIRIT